MTIKKLLKQIDTFTDEEREKHITLLLNNVLSNLSKAQIMNFQNKWRDYNILKDKSFDEFKVAQNKEIIDCIKMEMTEIGKYVRKIEGLMPLTDETIIE